MIRQLGPKDSASYYQIRLYGLKANPEAFGTGAEDWSKATDDQVKALLENNGPDDFVLGCFQQDELAGVVGLKREKKHSVAHKATVWGLMVRPEFRRKGIGTALLRELIASASQVKELQYLRAVITISDSNVTRLFESCGFTSYGIEPRGIKEGSRFFDQSFMMMNLPER